jgi:hypothetical protein
VSVLLGDVPPTVLSINRTNPPGPITSDSSVTYTVTFNEPVTGVDASDFSLALNGVTASTPVVTPVSQSVYTVTINGISGTGTLGLNLVDNGSIQNGAGNPLQPGGTATFQTSHVTTSASRHYAIALADVNGDGKPDLIVPSFDRSNVAVSLGNGDGTFQVAQTFATALDPIAVAVADFNGVGKPDLVVANDLTSGSVSVLLGNGNGTFQPQQTYAVGSKPFAVTVADLNRDGTPDLIVANFGRGPGISILLGNGNGTFQAQRTVNVGQYPLCVAVADVNGDGIPDLIVPDNNSVEVLLGNGDGTFQPAQTFNAGMFAPISSIAVADVNGDGRQDILVANRGDGEVGVLLGNGNGTFQSDRTFALSAPGYLTSIAVADINGDGKPDLVVTAAGSNAVDVLLGNGDGTFNSSQSFATSNEPWAAAVFDLNGDGRADVVVANVFSQAIDVLLGNSNADFTAQPYQIVPYQNQFNGTGGLDSANLTRDADGVHIDVQFNGETSQVAINDPAGLSFNDSSGLIEISLDYSNGTPLPQIVHLNGTFEILGLTRTDTLAGSTLEIGRSTVNIDYVSPNLDPIAWVRSYLQNGYNGGAWNGTPTATTGVITSAAAQANPNHNTAIGYADSADGQGINTTAGTIELTYTLYGDANLDHQVNSADLQILLFSLNRPGTWDQGDFNYDGQVNSADLQALLFTLNTSLGSQGTPMAIAATAAVTTPSTGASGSDPSPRLVPTIHATGTRGSVVLHPHAAKVAARKQR